MRKQKEPEIGGKVNGNRANYLHSFKDVDFMNLAQLLLLNFGCITHFRVLFIVQQSSERTSE